MNSMKMIAVLISAFMVMLFYSLANAAHHRQFSCKNKTATVGQTMGQVRDSLGEPFQIEESTPQNQNATSGEITKFFYKCESRTYVLVFQNETLVSIYQVTEDTSEYPVNEKK